MDYKQIYNQIFTKIHKVKSRETNIIFSSSILSTIAIFLIAIMATSLIESFAFGNEIFRGCLAVIILLATLIPLILKVYPATCRLLGIKYFSTDIDISRRIGKYYPEIHDSLQNAVELIEDIDHSIASKDLTIASFVTAASTSANKDFNVIIDKKRPRRTLFFFIASLTLAIVCFVGFPSTMGASFNRILHYSESFTPPAPFSLHIYPTQSNLLRGNKFRIYITAKGAAPLEVNLKIKEFSQNEFDTYPVQLDSGNTYYYDIPSVKTSLIYYASSEWLNSEVKSELCTLYVADKPAVTAISGRVNPPAYTRQPARSFTEENADLTLLRGSSVSFNLTSNRKLQTAKLIYKRTTTNSDSSAVAKTTKDSSIINFSISGKHAAGRFTPSTNGEYYFSLISTDGLESENSIHFNVYVTGDDSPTISLVQPYSDTKVSEDGILPTRVAISDDYGFSYLRLYYRLAESEYAEPYNKFEHIDVPFPTTSLTSDVPYIWNLNKVGISPKDRYEFYFEVADNDHITGPKTARTKTISVRLPSLEEIISSTNEAQKQIENDMSKIAKDVEEVKKQSEELNRDLNKTANSREQTSWEQKKKAESIIKKQQEIQNKVADLQKDLQNVTNQLNNNNIISQETLQKYMELQQLLKEINSPELKKYQEKMKQALDNLSPEQMQQALKNFKLNDEEFKKNIERTIQMLKRLQTEQQIDALMRKTDDLLNKMDELSKQLRNSNPADKDKKNDLAKSQAEIDDKYKSIEKDFNNLEKSLGELGNNNPKKQYEEAKNSLNSQETSQNMQSSASNIQSGNYNNAGKNQQSARNNMSNFKSGLQSMKNAMQSSLTKEAIKQMQKAASDINTVSKEQEKIKSKTKQLNSGSSQFPSLLEQQNNNLEALANVVSSMYALSQKTFAVTPEMAQNLGNAMNSMQQAMQSLDSHLPSQSAYAQEQAMSSLNKSVSQMQQMIGRMKSTGSCSNPGGMGDPKDGQGSGSGGMMQKLQELAAQQQAINQAMQQLGENGSSLSPQQQAQMKRLSDKQGNAEKTLEDLNKEQKEFAGGKKQPLGDLKKIAEEMKEVVRDMQSGNITPETRQKQDRILSRLLDATRSMTERDFDNQRTSRSGKDVIRRSPSDFDLSTQQGKADVLQEFLRSINQGYNKDYELLIKQYFESLNK